MTKHKAEAEVLAAVIATVLGAAVLVFAEQKAVRFRGAVKNMADDMTSLASGIKSVVGRIVARFAVQDGAAATSATVMATSAQESATATETASGQVVVAQGAMGDSAVAAASVTDAALMSTGIGVAVVALGLAAMELATHWKEVMGGF